ncbi:hypothetical protein DFH05DRAFT_1601498 [Lentinula detonsa]|uniref:Uncharacterized protein n=1 Tax=Lentinula detonsa TaxID=2804962 RepID=A0A9W8P664_9AGAR|nr:hypothetical protein DFH05DRAFT_1601498 [Lentinula detonsa]
MKVSPMFVVWQKGKPRIVMDQTASGINSSIPKLEGKVKYDDMHTFGQVINDVMKEHPNEELILFKSDVAKAFLNLPGHPLWQLCQVVTVDRRYHIVRRLVFGTQTSPRCWCSVSALLCWFGSEKLGIAGLHVYMDDFYGWDFKRNMIQFHSQSRPNRQVQLLVFWDMISCPYEDRKQEAGVCIKIIGFWLDIVKGSISLTEESITGLVQAIQDFLTSSNHKAPLRNWQQLTGSLHWLLNVLPWARPALTEMYRKMAGKTLQFHNIPINGEVYRDLTWFSDTLQSAIGIRFVDAQAWDDNEADFVSWTNASNVGLSFVYAGNGFCYQVHSTPGSPVVDIFFRELLAILSALHHIASMSTPLYHLLIYSDSLDSVQVLNSLAVKESSHNSILLAIAGIILKTGIDFRVRHVPGKDNIRADLLSRLLLHDFKLQFPSYRIRTFEPLRELLLAQ